MLLVSFGSPSAIAYAVTHIVQHVMQACLGSQKTFYVGDLQSLRSMLSSGETEEQDAILVFSDCPHLEFVRAFAATRHPIIVASDTLGEIVRYVMRSRAMPFAHAVRFATQVASALDLSSSAPNVLRIAPDFYVNTLRNLTARLIEYTGLRCSDDQFKAVMSGLGVGDDGAEQPFRAFVQERFPHAADQADERLMTLNERAALDALETDYETLAEIRDRHDVIWPTSLFLDWDSPGTFLDRTIDLLGPARFIVCGPYLHLPLGHWRMFVDFEVDECMSSNDLGADIFSGGILSAVNFRLPPTGGFGFHLDFEVTDPLLPIELRVQLMTGAIEGTFRLKNVQLSRWSQH